MYYIFWSLDFTLRKVYLLCDLRGPGGPRALRNVKLATCATRKRKAGLIGVHLRLREAWSIKGKVKESAEAMEKRLCRRRQRSRERRACETGA